MSPTLAGGFFTTDLPGRSKNTGVAYPFSKVTFQPRNWTRVSCIPGRFCTSWATQEAQLTSSQTVPPDFTPDLQFSLINVFLIDLLFTIIFLGPCLEVYFIFLFFFFLLTLYSSVASLQLAYLKSSLKMKSPMLNAKHQLYTLCKQIMWRAWKASALEQKQMGEGNFQKEHEI